MSNKPSMILITLDAVRADHLGCYGYRRNTSPNIDGLAKDGALFTQAISQDTWTVPSMTSILTSAPPFAHGVSYFADSVNPSLTALPEALKEHGYSTAFIGPFVVSTIKGFNRGFDLFNTGAGIIQQGLPTGLLRRLSTVNIMARFLLKMDNERADAITKRAISWLTARDDAPFFLWLHYFDAHGPYRPQGPYNRMFLNDGMGPSGNKDLPVLWKKVFGLGGIPHHVAEIGIRDFSYYVSQYDACIRGVDENIGLVLGALKKLNLYEDTIVVISADHGTYLGEHNFYFCHTGIPFEPLIRVPLIVKYDKIPKTKKIDAQVQSIDIAPTLLDLAAIDKPQAFTGESLRPLMADEGGARSPYCLIGDKKCAAIRTQDYKVMSVDYRRIENFEKMMDFRLRSAFSIQLEYLFGNNALPKELVFDLKEDPQETRNLARAGSCETEALQKMLLDNIGDVHSLPSRDGIFSEQTAVQEKLKSLGYLE